MNETTIEDLYRTLKSIEDGNPINEIEVDEHTRKYAKLALDRMLEIR
jgi:quinolinate synthase